MNELNQTVFDLITASEETLAEKLVYRAAFNSYGGVKLVWRSTLYPDNAFWYSEAEAIAATVAKLKEVAK